MGISNAESAPSRIISIILVSVNSLDPFRVGDGDFAFILKKVVNRDPKDYFMNYRYIVIQTV